MNLQELAMPDHERRAAQQELLGLSDNALLLLQLRFAEQYREGYKYGVFIEHNRELSGNVTDATRLDTVLRLMPVQQFRDGLGAYYQQPHAEPSPQHALAAPAPVA